MKKFYTGIVNHRRFILAFFSSYHLLRLSPEPCFCEL